MPFNTELTRRLGIKIPVVQGGMQWVGYAELASAVSNAGGLGIVSSPTNTTTSTTHLFLFPTTSTFAPDPHHLTTKLTSHPTS